MWKFGLSLTNKRAKYIFDKIGQITQLKPTYSMVLFSLLGIERLGKLYHQRFH